jgi:uncharacterized membrane protein
MLLTAAYAVTALVALLHIYFLVLEMFLWDKPAGMKPLNAHKTPRFWQPIKGFITGS